jgi:aspartate aminotransferase
MLEMLQRSEVSNPPAYGAKIASTILSSASLRQAWYDDLITMSDRIRSMRKALHDTLMSNGKSPGITSANTLTGPGAPGSWEHLVRQSGMFGFLGLSPSVVLKLRGSFCS